MGKRAIRKAVNAESQHYAHVMIELIQTDAHLGKIWPVQHVITAALLDGMEIGMRVAVGDIVRGRRLIEMFELDMPTEGERKSVGSADRLLKALSKE